MKKVIVIAVSFLFFIIIAYGQPKDINSVDSLLTEMTNNDLFSGAVLVADSSRVLLSKGYGYADRENKIKNSPDTRFDISTASNIFTATAITLLAEQARLKFTDKIGKYIRHLPRGNEITIYQILTHTAGFDYFDNAKGFSYKNVKNCTDIMPFMAKLPLLYHPGDSCIYSSGDLIVLGALIEKLCGTNYQDYITQTFVKPLGLSNTGFVPYFTLNNTQRQYAIGYSKGGSAFVRKAFNYDNGFIPLSAGGDWSSVNDLYTFDKAVFSNKILKKEYVRQMTGEYSSQWENTHFGYIWVTNDKKNYPSVGHTGYSSAWQAINNFYPNQKYTLIILTNFGSVDIDKLAGTIEQIIFGTD